MTRNLAVKYSIMFLCTILTVFLRLTAVKAEGSTLATFHLSTTSINFDDNNLEQNINYSITSNSSDGTTTLGYSITTDSDIKLVDLHNNLNVVSVTTSNKTGTLTIDNNIKITNDSLTFSITKPIKAGEYSGKTKIYFNVNSSQSSFSFTNGEQTFTAPVAGIYKVEVWGAQGGSSSTSMQRDFATYIKGVGGYGGYSVGTVTLSEGETLYINVGGEGGAADYSNTSIKAGYNGGGLGGVGAITYWQTTRGKGAAVSSGGGGGATSIAFVSGTLPTLSSYKGNLNSSKTYYISDKILIVAGGGGGYSIARLANAGSGGGISGGIGLINSGNSVAGATQTTGYKFGQGQNGHNSIQGISADAEGSGGAGGGFFGGLSYQGVDLQSDANGSGGSGYIASSRLKSTNNVIKQMICYDCSPSTDSETKTTATTNTGSHEANKANTGDGYAKITLLATT